MAKRKKRHPISVFVTMLAVAGIFGTVMIPAYAFGSGASAASGVAKQSGETQAVSVSKDAVTAEQSRGDFTATSANDLRLLRASSLRVAALNVYNQSGARALGDDYPWYAQPTQSQGGGLSPLNYFYRECVDFVAWRLNRDAGDTTAPFIYNWQTLTPNGGNAYQWKSAWIQHGWQTSNVPVVGSVAWFSYNHVAYVKAVNADGTVLLEEYNWNGLHLYDQRTIPASDVDLFLYPPPR